MRYIFPDDLIKMLNIDNINDITISMLKYIAEMERPYALKYYNDPNSLRSHKQREDNVVNGKFGELFVMMVFAKSGYIINQGVAFSDSNEIIYGDGGYDLIVNNKKVQIKFCSGNYFNLSTERQEDAIKLNLKNDILIIICYKCETIINNERRKTYKLKKLTDDCFNTYITESIQPNCKSYILLDNIPEFDGKIN